MIAIGKNLCLLRKVAPPAVDKIDAGQPAFCGDFLRAHVFLGRHGVIGSTLYRGVVAKHHTLLPLDQTNAGNRPCARGGTIVHSVCCGCTNLQKRAAKIK